MLAHHSITGCPIQVGDLLGSGTISGEEVGSFGSMYEQSTNGKNPIPLNDGETRTFLEDYDTITFRGWAGGNDGEKIGFGNCSGTIQPALDLA